MAFSRQELKTISIIQLVMSVILFALGIVDHFEVRYTYLSHLLMPCWIAALVVPASIMGLILAIRSRRSPILINWLTSISIASVVVSAVVLEAYSWALKALLSFKYDKYDNTEVFSFFGAKDTKIKFEDQENTMIAIHALIVIFTICEIILALATARSGETGCQSPQENQSGYPYHHIESGQVPIQLQAFPTQAMMTIPISGVDYRNGGLQQRM
ncbi:unnamed protein product [Pocillopora meandrina]|uniref:Uncharacterized protein n=1 Tax=Pocillopora meandrina TaxID=46732 RepID=A0AAU9XD42_9CNID|nr:unnamed protein product [Pocillopora meandrina]